MKQRSGSVLIVVLLALFAFSGLSAGKVIIWETRAPGDQFEPYQVEYDRMIASIKEDLGIDVEVVFYGSDIRGKLATTIGTEHHPDLITYPQWDLILAGMYEDLMPYIQRSGFDISRYPQQALDHFSLDGKLYVLPQAYNHEVLYYNRTLFDRFGLVPPPQAWDDPNWTVSVFADLARKGTQINGNGQYETAGVGRVSNIFIRSWWWDASWIDEQGKASVSHPGITQALEWARDLAEVGSLMPEFDNPGDFARGNVFMFMNSDIDLQMVHNLVQGGFDWNVAPLPKATNAATNGWIGGYTMLSRSDNKDEAWQVLEWMETDPIAGNITVKISGYTPAHPDRLEMYFNRSGTVLPEGLNLPMIVEGHQYARKNPLEEHPSWTDVFRAIYYPAVDVKNGELSSTAYVEQVGTQIRALRGE